jgi:hypothetical protein
MTKTETNKFKQILAQSRASSRRNCRDAAGPAELSSAIPSGRESSNRHGRAGPHVEEASSERGHQAEAWGSREGSEGGSGLLRVGGGRHLVGSRGKTGPRGSGRFRGKA